MVETYEFHTDPGHGWLKVPRARINELKIQNKITHYSYEKDGFVYAEEDVDFGIIYQALKNIGIQLKTIEINSDNESVIRNYKSFKP